MRERPEGRQGPTKGLWITFLSRAFIFATSSKLLKSGPLSPSESAAPIFFPIPPTPQEVGANIIQSELWPSVGAFQFPLNFLGCCEDLVPTLMRFAAPSASCASRTDLSRTITHISNLPERSYERSYTSAATHMNTSPTVSIATDSGNSNTASSP
jgi:hypothetical protein